MTPLISSVCPTGGVRSAQLMLPERLADDSDRGGALGGVVDASALARARVHAERLEVVARDQLQINGDPLPILNARRRIG